ncbi:MAG: transposase [Nitrosomonas sp.]|nr:transposase [Nitrosomonas sp.]
MKKSKYSEQQIISLLKEVELGANKVADVCRKYGISEATYYKWKAAYGGMDVSQLGQLRALQAENAKLKKMYAELAVHDALQDVVEKKL